MPVATRSQLSAGLCGLAFAISLLGADAAGAFDDEGARLRLALERRVWASSVLHAERSVQRRGLPDLAEMHFDAPATSPAQGLFDRAKRIPLRPVRIGEKPRTPDDPEPGMGVVVRISF